MKEGFEIMMSNGKSDGAASMRQNKGEVQVVSQDSFFESPRKASLCLEKTYKVRGPGGLGVKRVEC